MQQSVQTKYDNENESRNDTLRSVTILEDMRVNFLVLFESDLVKNILGCIFLIWGLCGLRLYFLNL
jgi:hypothetical protein